MSLKDINITAYPSFYGKNDNVLDPRKLSSRPANFTLETIPEEEEEDVPQAPVTKPKTSEKTVKFAPYADVYIRCPMIGTRVRYPGEMIDELEEKNEQLKQELLSARQKIDKLNIKLNSTKNKLVHTRTINRRNRVCLIILIIDCVVLLFSYLFK
jgi:hypothetical protein